MAVFGTTELGFKATGKTVNIPDDPRARLMYYLESICTVLDLNDDPDINRLKNYGNYRNLRKDESKLLVQVCSLLSPDLLEGRCIFQSDALCRDSGNEFYEIEAVRNNLMVAGNVMIGGRRRQVTSIMTYKMSWLQRNYTEPMERLQREGCTIL